MVSKYFKIQELVSKNVFDSLGEGAFRLFSNETLRGLDSLREFFGRPITINNWHIGGNFSQRGLRENISEIVKSKTLKNSLYLSSHCFGFGFDINVEGMTAEEVFNLIIENQDKFPFILRMEGKIDKTTGKPRTWTHVEIRERDKNKIVVFEA